MTELQQLHRRIYERFVKAFVTYQLLKDNDHVLVGLSGGKDSLCLLEMLAQRSRIDFPKFSVEAVHVRMDNINYETSTDYLEQFCREQNVALHIVNTSFTVSKVPLSSSRDARRQKQPCFLCSWNRRKQIFNMAQELGCNKIAFGHHQDDLLHTAIMNIMYQGRFATMPARLVMKKMPLTIIRPLCMVPESDIQRYAELRGYEKQLKQCPYEHDSHRNDAKKLLDALQQSNPEVRHSMWKALLRDNKLVEE